ncbi:hypothetical protein J6590_093710, partial [Homalodisca vitripennis]
RLKLPQTIPGLWSNICLKRSKTVDVEEVKIELFASFRYQRHLDLKIKCNLSAEVFQKQMKVFGVICT